MPQTQKPFILRFWRGHDDRAKLLQEAREVYRQSQPFARLLHSAVAHQLRGGQVQVEGKPNAKKVLGYVLGKLRAQEQAKVPQGKAGKWQWLKLSEHPHTGKRAWGKVTRAVAWAHSQDSGVGDTPFTLMRVLGYPADITRKQARVVERAHYPKFFRLNEGAGEVRDLAYDLDPQQNEHFRDDRGFYDDAMVLRSHGAPEETWEAAYSTIEEAWNGVHAREEALPRGGRFYPAPLWSREYRRVDWHGAMRLLEHREHREACRKELAELEQRRALAPRQPAEAPWWSLSETERENIRAGAELRRQKLAEEAAEVEATVLEDVPLTDVQLLEDQLKGFSKAPKGLVAALARERLAEQEREAKLAQHQRGMVALEQAARAA
jgi:hypothetical protein